MSVPVRGSCWKITVNSRWRVLSKSFLLLRSLLNFDKSHCWPYWALAGSRGTVFRFCHALRFDIYGKDTGKSANLSGANICATLRYSIDCFDGGLFDEINNIGVSYHKNITNWFEDNMFIYILFLGTCNLQFMLPSLDITKKFDLAKRQGSRLVGLWAREVV